MDGTPLLQGDGISGNATGIETSIDDKRIYRITPLSAIKK